ncbi:MAG: hypothetical protein ACTS73_04365 [Arsenophonus sp. NEOnobi-MAG3]
MNSYPDIKQSFVIPMVDKEFGYRPVAVIESDNQQLLSSLNQWLNHQLAAFQRSIADYLLPGMLIDNAGIKLSGRDIKKWLLEYYYDNKLD